MILSYSGPEGVFHYSLAAAGCRGQQSLDIWRNLVRGDGLTDNP